MTTENIEWCLDQLDEINSENGQSFDWETFNRLVSARQELEKLKAQPTQEEE